MAGKFELKTAKSGAISFQFSSRQWPSYLAKRNVRKQSQRFNGIASIQKNAADDA